jgi:hypothetical protein
MASASIRFAELPPARAGSANPRRITSDDLDELRVIRGVGAGILLSIPCWTGVVLLVRAVLG